MDDRARIRRMTGWFLALIVVVAALGLLRMQPPRALISPAVDIFAWNEFISLTVLVPLMFVVLWQIFRLAADDATGVPGVFFVVGVYAVGLGLGLHDAGELLLRAYREPGEPLRQSLLFFDERLGHWCFWAGFLLSSVATGGAHLRRPLREPLGARAAACWVALGMPLAAVMLINLMFERTGIDLCIIMAALLATVAQHILRPTPLRRLPLLLLLYPAYLVAVLGTLAYWIVRPPV